MEVSIWRWRWVVGRWWWWWYLLHNYSRLWTWCGLYHHNGSWAWWRHLHNQLGTTPTWCDLYIDDGSTTVWRWSATISWWHYEYSRCDLKTLKTNFRWTRPNGWTTESKLHESFVIKQILLIRSECFMIKTPEILIVRLGMYMYSLYIYCDIYCDNLIGAVCIKNMQVLSMFFTQCFDLLSLGTLWNSLLSHMWASLLVLC